jgi:hypothetical protein
MDYFFCGRRYTYVCIGVWVVKKEGELSCCYCCCFWGTSFLFGPEMEVKFLEMGPPINVSPARAAPASSLHFFPLLTFLLTVETLWDIHKFKGLFFFLLLRTQS